MNVHDGNFIRSLHSRKLLAVWKYSTFHYRYSCICTHISMWSNANEEWKFFIPDRKHNIFAITSQRCISAGNDSISPIHALTLLIYFIHLFVCLILWNCSFLIRPVNFSPPPPPFPLARFLSAFSPFFSTRKTSCLRRSFQLLSTLIALFTSDILLDCIAF